MENLKLSPDDVPVLTKKVIPKLTEMRVGSDTNVGKLAAAIKCFRDSTQDRNLRLRYIGAGAGQQAFKAVIIANRMLLSMRAEFCIIIPSFGEETANNSTVMYFELRFLPIASY